MQVEWFVAIKIIYVESSITINISESVFVMYKSQVFKSIITMNHIDTGTKTAAGTRSPLRRTRLLDAGSYSFL